MSKSAALAICTTALGDTLLCTPAISALGAVYKLDVLVHQHTWLEESVLAVANCAEEPTASGGKFEVG